MSQLNFTRPPITELVLSVQFEPLKNLRLVDFGRYFSVIEEAFPTSEHKNPLAAVDEGFDSPTHQAIRVELVNAEPLPRCWFKSKDGSYLIQIQADRFIFNWIKTDAATEYPRFDKMVDKYREWFLSYRNFLKEIEPSELKFTQCELTYVNIIPVAHENGGFASAPRIFSFLSNRSIPDVAVVPEDYSASLRHVLKNDKGEKVGRLHINVQPAIRAGSEERVYRMEIVARGIPLGQGTEGVENFFRLGSRAVNASFAASTTPEMHKYWDQKNE